MAKRYSKSPIADETAYQKKLHITRKYLKPDMKVLEFGCGTGSTAIAHAPYVKHIHAIDFSSGMLAIAQEKANAQNIENITFERATIEDINVPDQTLDAVLGFSILHLLESKEETIAKIYKMLKPGGILVTSTMCLGDSVKFFKFIVPVVKLFGLTLQIFTAKDLENYFTAAGFKIDHHWQPPGKDKAVFIVAKKV